MSFLDKLTALIPFGKEKEELEYFFALNISSEKLTAALWTIEGKHLKIVGTASGNYSSLDELPPKTDKLLDSVLGIRELDVQKILFGVPSTWLSDDNLKDDNLKILRGLVKELELKPMAYVETAHALVHFLEKQESIPPTAILVGFEEHHLTVTVVRAGKLDGVKVVSRGDLAGAGIEKALLTFTSVETLPSKILIYGEDVQELRSQLLSFPWMSKLSFLHFPRIDILQDELEIKSVCLAGASEIKSDVYYTDMVNPDEVEIGKEKDEKIDIEQKSISEDIMGENLGFVVGDVATTSQDKETKESEGANESVSEKEPDEENKIAEHELAVPEEASLAEVEDFQREVISPSIAVPEKHKGRFNFKSFAIARKFTNIIVLGGIIGILLLILSAYLFLLKAEVKIFVEPKILEKDAQVIADPNQKAVNEDAKIIPGQIVDTKVSGSGKDRASGKKQIGDPAKGTVVVRNKTDSAISLSKGTILSATGLKFSLDLSVNVASRSAEDGTWGKSSVTVTAQTIGADGNLPSGSDMTISGYSEDKLIAKTEGNFSGGTSKEVAVVSSEDQQRLLASLSSTLRKQAQQALQEKLPQKKLLEEALSEEIVKKSFNKNINDQATDFSLNLEAKYKGTAYDDKDLKLIVSKLIDTQVPAGFELNLDDTETQADVSKLEKDGKLIFLARFRAKLLPKLDTEKIKNQIKGKSTNEATAILKEMDNVLGSEIKVSPALPPILQRLPLLSRNIKVEVGLK